MHLPFIWVLLFQPSNESPLIQLVLKPLVILEMCFPALSLEPLHVVTSLSLSHEDNLFFNSISKKSLNDPALPVRRLLKIVP